MFARRRTDGKHIHPCQNPAGCTAVWEHGNDCAKMFGGTGTKEGLEFFNRAHTCPVCGYMEDNPRGLHGTDAPKPTVDHPVQCPVGEFRPDPLDAIMEDPNLRAIAQLLFAIGRARENQNRQL